MIALLGNVALSLAIVFLLPLIGDYSMRSQRAMTCHHVSILIAVLLLILAFITNDMSIEYVSMNSDESLPLVYKVVALWGGHSGSLLLLTFMMSSWVWFYHHLNINLRLYGLAIVSLLIILLWFSNPFSVNMVHLNSTGLNPLLQDMGMMIHPPILYLGYIASVLPFLLVLTKPKLVSQDLVSVKKISAIALSILTLGITLGSWWAYRVLGWGGYWGWDPVENASLLPWLALLGLHHAVLTKDLRNTQRFALLGFILSIFSTAMVRSGMLASVHAFAHHLPSLICLLAYLAATIIVGVIYWIRHRGERLRVPWAIRLHFGIVIFLISLFCLTIVLPSITSLWNMPIIINERFFQKIMMPILFLILFGLGSYLTYQPRSLAIGTLIGLIYAYMTKHYIDAGAIAITVTILTTLYLKPKRNNAHIMFLALVSFILLNAQMSEQQDMVLAVGEQDEGVILHDTLDTKGANYIEKTLVIEIEGHQLSPSMRYFPKHDIATSVPAISHSFISEWYVVVNSMVDTNIWSITIYHQYWIRWIWASALAIAVIFIQRARKHV